VVLSGTSFFPFLLRNVVLLGHRLVPWRYKIVFDYILLNHHHLSTLLFPKLQTRIYLSVTLLFYLIAVSISLILDLHNPYLAQFTPGIRLLIFVFHSVSARFAGFQTIDISHFATATLIIYLLLMVTKPQMLCALSKSRLELVWMSLRANQKVEEDEDEKEDEEEEEEEQQQDSATLDPLSNAPALYRRIPSAASDAPFAERQVNFYLSRQRVTIKGQAGKTKKSDNDAHQHRYVSHLYFRLFLLDFVQAIFKDTMYTLKRPHTWLFIFIFLICAIENDRITVDPNITVFKIVFEIVSAFGCVGLSLGYPGVSSSFSTVLSPVSRVIVGLTMLLGRHRGLLASMKDQENIEHSATDLLDKWKKEAIRRYKSSIQEKVVITRF
jgi:hypothetical protein